MKKSSLEEKFDNICALYEGKNPYFYPDIMISNYKFLTRFKRNYAIDRAWPFLKVGVELEGGTWSKSKSGHISGSGYESNVEKYNLAKLDGWIILQFTTSMIERAPKQVLATIIQMLKTTSGIWLPIKNIEDFYTTSKSNLQVLKRKYK